MKRFFEKVGFDRKKKKNDDDFHPKTNVQHAPDEGGSRQLLHDASDIKSNQLNREELDNSIQAVSQAIESTRGITGKHDSSTLADYNGQLGISVVERLSVFTNAVQKIADAHPYSKMAWMIISSVVTVVTYTQGIDQDMQDLFETLDSTYKFIEDTKEIESIPAYERILTDIAKQTVDCAYFIRAYAKNSNFWVRAGKNLIGRPIKPQVQTYKDAFAKLLAQFQIHSALHTEIATIRLLECNQSLKINFDLDSLPYAGGAGLQIGKQCLVGTRTEVLDEIVDWINDADENCPRLFWLAGPAGVGKSAIAHSIAARFEAIGRLGSFFCFDKNDSTNRREKVFSTIARDLADLDPQIKHQLAEVIQNKASLRSTTDLLLQWKNFLFQPLHVTSEFSTGPILVVIDALDESGDPISRQDLLNILAKEIPSLPPNVRFLVTSRSERDITLVLNKPSQSHVRSKMMDSIPETETNRDILTYFKVKLVEEGSCAFEDTQLGQLVILSQGLFQWAFLASQYLKGLGNTAGLTDTERYEDLINIQRIGYINDPLDTMYTKILSSLFNSGDPRVMTRFRSIIGSILAASEPLSTNSLVVLRGDNILPSKREADIKGVVQHMGALLSGISGSSSTIRPLHLSFREYLLDKNRSHDYWVDLTPCHQGLAFGCLRTMMEGLKFNICSISTSHRANADDENLPEQISSSISRPLSYSCRFWAIHVTSSASDRLLATKTKNFLYHGFLLWLEVLSLLKTANVAVKSMSGLMAWSSGKEYHEALYNFAADGKQFVRLFIDVITVSAPHIYISALPFCPQDSIIYQTFIDHFPNTLRITSKPIAGWPSVQKRASVGKASCICFSHGGEYLAVGLEGVLRLLDVETLDVLWTVKIPENTNKTIDAIQFYTNDKQLAFATCLQVYLFNILTGDLAKLLDITSDLTEELGITGDLTLDSYLSTSAHFEEFSQNAKFVTCVHEDRLTVWNLHNQEAVIEIPSSPSYGFLNNDSDILVTYLANVGIQVWDLQTYTILPGHDIPLLTPPTSDPFQLPFGSSLRSPFLSRVSPNGIHIIFPSHLHVWNFRDNSVLDLDSECDILAISPNGKYVATQRAPSTVILYDIKGNKTSYENVDGNFYMNCIAFSKDNRRFAINDKWSLKVWELDAESTPRHGYELLPPTTRFLKASPAGIYHLFSMEHNNEIWDAESNSSRSICMEHSYEIWNAESNQSICKLSMATPLGNPTFSPMCRYLGWICAANAVSIHDIGSGTKGSYFGDQKATIQCLAFSKDETLMATLAVNSSQKTISICTWDIDSFKIVNTLTIPDVMYDLDRYPIFKASSNFRYFAYSFSTESSTEGSKIFLYSHTARLIPLDFSPNLISPLYCDFDFSLDETHVFVSTDHESVFHMNLMTNEHQGITLQNNHSPSFSRHQMCSTTSGALLLQIDDQWPQPAADSERYRIWNAFTGELLYCLQPYSNMLFASADFIPGHQHYLVTSATDKDGSAYVWKLELEKDDWICFSSDEKHSLKSLPRGSSATLKPDGWIVTENNELLFWVPNEYHQTLHVPQLKYLVGAESTKLDLSSFAHGQSWTACYKA